MKYIYALMFLTVFSLAKEPIEMTNYTGKWFGGSLDNRLFGGFIECPDRLIIKPNFKYEVFNPCESSNGGYSIIENGKWKIKDGKIELFSRVFFEKSYRFLNNKNKVLIFSLSNDALLIKITVDDKPYSIKFYRDPLPID